MMLLSANRNVTAKRLNADAPCVPAFCLSDNATDCMGTQNLFCQLVGLY